MDINVVIEELRRFSPEFITFEAPAKSDDIAAFQGEIKLQLPEDFKYLLLQFNGVDLCGISIYGVKVPDGPYSLNELYLFEHNEVGNPMPSYLMPFSPDGAGNHYCIDARIAENETSKIVFWQHDYFYAENDGPEVVATSFAEWAQEVMIAWTLEDFNYDGTEK